MNQTHLFFLIAFVFSLHLLKAQDYKIIQEKRYSEANKILKITADKSTHDPKLGYDYSILRVFIKQNNDQLKEIKKFSLDKNFPGLPYQIWDSYEGEKAFVLITARYHFYIYDLKNDELSMKLKPEFKNDECADSQSGTLGNFTFTKNTNVLKGYATDFGNFYYDLQNITNPRQISKPEECEAYTPARGTDERKAILDPMRERFKETKLDIVFVVQYMKVSNGWAWVHALPQSKDGVYKLEDMSALVCNKDGDWRIAEIPNSCAAEDEEDVSPDCIEHKDYFKNLKKRFPQAPICIFPDYK